MPGLCGGACRRRIRDSGFVIDSSFALRHSTFARAGRAAGSCAAFQALVGSPLSADWPDWSAAMDSFIACQSSSVMVHSRAWEPL